MCAKTGDLDRSTNRDKVKFEYSTNPDKAKPAERQGQKAPGLRTTKMAELPKDVTSFRGGSAFMFGFSTQYVPLGWASVAGR
jgi:hypothetical protein